MKRKSSINKGQSGYGRGIFSRVLSRLINKNSSSDKNKKNASEISSQKDILDENDVTKVEKTKFSHHPEFVQAEQDQVTATIAQEKPQYNLPIRYNDNRIAIMPRDPWWIYAYWDITQDKIDEVINSIPFGERKDLKWVLRVHDVSGIADFNGDNSRYFYDLDINFEANNWYLNVNKPESSWCVEIGLINAWGKFFLVARSNIIMTPYFGISDIIDEEWALSDEEYYRLLGLYDMGLSSMQKKKRIQEMMRQQLSSPLGSWGGSFVEKKEVEQFPLEVWTEVIVHGRTHADAKVTIEGKDVEVRGDGSFSVRYCLPEGDFRYEVKAVSRNKKHTKKEIPAVKRYKKK